MPYEMMQSYLGDTQEFDGLDGSAAEEVGTAVGIALKILADDKQEDRARIERQINIERETQKQQQITKEIQKSTRSLGIAGIVILLGIIYMAITTPPAQKPPVRRP